MNSHAYLTMSHKLQPLTMPPKTQPLTEGLLTVGSFWKREGQFSLRLWLLVGQSTCSEHTQELLGTTD